MLSWVKLHIIALALVVVLLVSEAVEEQDVKEAFILLAVRLLDLLVVISKKHSYCLSYSSLC